MNMNIDTRQRLRPTILEKDIESLYGLGTVSGYLTSRLEATPEALQQSYDAMVAAQKAVAESAARHKATMDAVRLAEWEFHSSMVAMRECVRGQFGSDSDEAQAVGMRKKSERRRPRRQSA